MNKYKDILESELIELTETPNDKKFLAKAKIKWGKSDERNKNDRIYSDLVAAPAILKFNKEAQLNAGILGNLDHPVGTSGTLLSNASHLVSKVWKDENKIWWADVKILNTSKGKDLLAVLKTGATIGASLRGVGEINKKGEVLPGLEFRAIDFVSSPSFGASATVDQSNVFESYVPEEEEYQFNEEDLKEITNAMDSLNDGTIKLIQEKLAKEDNIEMTAEKVKALSLWIRLQKNNPKIAPYSKWFNEQEKLFTQDNPNLQEELNDRLRREANMRNENRIAGVSYGIDRKRIEARQQEINEALSGSKYDAKTISRLFAEALLAGYKGSRADWIKEFGF